jgi:hypothetical protein
MSAIAGQYPSKPAFASPLGRRCYTALAGSGAPMLVLHSQNLA